jgi:uncharacterized protein YxjI
VEGIEMKLLFKQRFFSWFDSYDIYNELGETVYTVKGVLSWGHCLKIYDSAEREVGMLKEEVLTFLPKFRMFLFGNEIGTINKEFTFFRPKFYLDCNGWSVEGDYFEWDYSVMDGSQPIMTASKKLWNFTDTYEIDVIQPENALVALMIVLAIDAAKCGKN